MMELYCEYLSVRCIWLYVLVMSRTRFRVNPHSIAAWMSRNSLFEAARSVCLRTKSLWVRFQLQSLKLQISCLLRAKSSLTFMLLWSVDSLWNAYVTYDKNIQPYWRYSYVSHYIIITYHFVLVYMVSLHSFLA